MGKKHHTFYSHRQQLPRPHKVTSMSMEVQPTSFFGGGGNADKHEIEKPLEKSTTHSLSLLFSVYWKVG